MQLLPMEFWQDFLTHKQMNLFPKNHSPLLSPVGFVVVLENYGT